MSSWWRTPSFASLGAPGGGASHYELTGRSDGHEAVEKWVPTLKRAEPLLRGVRRAQRVEGSVVVDSRRIPGNRLDERVGGGVRTRARRHRVRSTRSTRLA